MFIKRKPGQRSLLIPTPAREVNHVDLAHRVCSFDPSIRSLVFQAGFPVRTGVAHWRHSCHRQTHRDSRLARHGPGSADVFSNLSSGIESRRVVHSCGQPDLAVAAGARLRARGAVDLRFGRHHRTALGREDCRPRHLPRPGALQSKPLRQDQRFALAVHDAAGTDTVGGPSLGAAFFDGIVPVRALSRQSGQAPQDTHRLGASTRQAGQPLVARTAVGHRGRQHFLGIAFSRRGKASCHRHHPLASGCRPVCAAAAPGSAAERR